MSIWIGCVALLAQAGPSLPPSLACEQSRFVEAGSGCASLTCYAEAIATDRNRIVVGADEASVPFLRSGSVWVYLRADLDWKLEAQLVARDNAPGAGFGSATSTP